MDLGRVYGFATDTDGTIWYIERRSNCLIHLNLKDSSILECSFIPELEGYGLAVSNGVVTDRYVIFAPFTFHSVIVYSKYEKTIRFLRLEVWEGYYNLFVQVIASQGHIFFIPFCYNSLVELDEENLELNYHNVINPAVFGRNKGDAFIRVAGIKDDRILIMPEFMGNQILIYDYRKKAFKKIELSMEIKISMIIIDKDYLWLLSYKKNELYLYDHTLSELKRRIVLSDSQDDSFGMIVDCDTYVVAFQNGADSSYVINKKDFSVEKIDINIKNDPQNIAVVQATKLDDKRVVISVYGDRSIIGIYSTDDKNVKWIDLPDENYGMILKRNFHNDLIKENSSNDLQVLFNVLNDKEHFGICNAVGIN